GKTARVRRPPSGTVFARRSVKADADGAHALVCGLSQRGSWTALDTVPAHPWRSAPVKLVLRNCLGQEDVMKGLIRIVVPLLLLTGTARAAGTDPAAFASTRAAAKTQCPCESFASHKSYVHCVAQFAKAAATSGSLPKQCKAEVLGCARKSTCGSKGFETCCRTTATGRTKCSLKSATAKCTAPKGGSACMRTVPSC